jgi:hypothetical protein
LLYQAIEKKKKEKKKEKSFPSLGPDPIIENEFAFLYLYWFKLSFIR